MDAINNLFTPLGKENCVIYYYFSLVGLVGFVIALISVLMLIVKGKMNTLSILNSVSLLVSTFLSYYLNRLMYSICITSLN